VLRTTVLHCDSADRLTRDRHDLPTSQPKWQYPAESWEY